MSLTTGLTLAELKDLQKDLERNIFLGVKRIERDGRETEFQSITQMKQALELLNSTICQLEGTGGKTVLTPTVVY